MKYHINLRQAIGFAAVLSGFLLQIETKAQLLTNKGKTITISAGAIVTVNGSLLNIANGGSNAEIQNNGTLQLTGDLQSDATTTYSGSGTLELTGTGAQQFSGTSFYDLKITGAGTKTTNGNSTIQNNLTFGSGITASINTVTNQDTLILGSSATISETATGYITGWVKTERLLAENVPYSFGGLGLAFEAKGAAPGLTNVIRGTGNTAIQTGEGNEGIARTFMISPANNASLNADLTFTYNDNELNSLPEGDLMLFKSTDEGVTWIPVGYASRNAATNTITASGINSFSWWTAGSAATPLPVSWLSFTGRAAAEANILTWATASEKNSKSFTVERSTDGKQFSEIGEVKAAGNSNQQNSYSFSDKNAAAIAQKVMYYRLKQLDFDGKFEYAPIVSLNRQTETAGITAYPNPFSNELSLAFKTSAVGPAIITLTAPDGHTVYRRMLSETQARGRITLTDLPQLATGLYMLQATQAGKTTQLKIARQ